MRSGESFRLDLSRLSRNLTVGGEGRLRRASLAPAAPATVGIRPSMPAAEVGCRLPACAVEPLLQRVLLASTSASLRRRCTSAGRRS